MMLKVLVIYDSYFGPTQAIGEAIADAFPKAVTARTTRVSPAELRGFDLIIIGSPTKNFRPTKDTQELIAGIKPAHINGTMIAAFDTRLDRRTSRPGIVQSLADLAGNAASSIQKQLFRKGGKPLVGREGFYTLDVEGPLAAGELERAKAWGAGLEAIARKISMQSAP